MVPVHRPPDLLSCALNSIVEQTVQDFEVHIICDGAPIETGIKAKQWAERDDRFFAHILPKGRRHGEEHRDRIINASKAKYVCQIADDDLWFHNHLEVMRHLLECVDFGHSIQLQVEPSLEAFFDIRSLVDTQTRERMQQSLFNVFGPTAAGYRRDTYKRLKTGWSPAPGDIWTDLFMWRKFLNMGSISVGFAREFTNLCPRAISFQNSSLSERRTVNELLLKQISDPQQLHQLTLILHDALNRMEYRHDNSTPERSDSTAYVRFDLSHSLTGTGATP